MRSTWADPLWLTMHKPNARLSAWLPEYPSAATDRRSPHRPILNPDISRGKHNVEEGGTQCDLKKLPPHNGMNQQHSRAASKLVPYSISAQEAAPARRTVGVGDFMPRLTHLYRELARVPPPWRETSTSALTAAWPPNCCASSGGVGRTANPPLRRER